MKSEVVEAIKVVQRFAEAWRNGGGGPNETALAIEAALKIASDGAVYTGPPADDAHVAVGATRFSDGQEQTTESLLAACADAALVTGGEFFGDLTGVAAINTKASRFMSAMENLRHAIDGVDVLRARVGRAEAKVGVLYEEMGDHIDDKERHEATIRRLEVRVGVLTAALRENEWVDAGEVDGMYGCDRCGRRKVHGHTPGCLFTGLATVPDLNTKVTP